MASTALPNVTDNTVHVFEAVQAAQVAARMVEQEAFLAALVSKDLSDAFLGPNAKGGTVDVKVPAALIARDRNIDDKTTGIVLDEITEQTTSVSLGTHAYSAVSLSEKDLNYNLKDFSRQVLAPQTEAVADYIENAVAEALLAETIDTTVRWDGTAPEKTFTQIRKILRQRGVPQTNLQVVVGTDVYAALLDAKAITDASQSGSTEALRQGNVGAIRGFQIVESTRVPDGDIIAFHRDAYTLAVKAPAVPAGAPFGASVSDGGYPMRWIRDYATGVMADRSVVSTFAGVAKMPLYKVTRDYGASTVAVTEDPLGAVFRMSIADGEPV